MSEFMSKLGGGERIAIHPMRGFGRDKGIHHRKIDRVGITSIERSEEHTSELQSQSNLVCRLLLDPATSAIYTLSLHDALPIWALAGLEADISRRLPWQCGSHVRIHEQAWWRRAYCHPPDERFR